MPMKPAGELLRQPTLEGEWLRVWTDDLMEFRHTAWKLLKQREVEQG